MGVTAQGIYFPDPSGLPRRQDLEDMAESVDAALTPVTETVTSLGLTVAADWTVNFFAAAKIGVQRMIQIRITYSGDTITGGVGGTMPDTTVISGLPEDWRPGTSAVFPFSRGVGTYHGTGMVSATGDIILATLAENAVIATDNAVGLNIAYLGALT